MPKYRKGESGNILGKPKGTCNRTTAQIREAIQLIVDNNIETLQRDLDSLEPIERVKALTALASFVLPKPLAVDMTARVDNTAERASIYETLNNMSRLSVAKDAEEIEAEYVPTKQMLLFSKGQ